MFYIYVKKNGFHVPGSVEDVRLFFGMRRIKGYNNKFSLKFALCVYKSFLYEYLETLRLFCYYGIL